MTTDARASALNAFACRLAYQSELSASWLEELVSVLAGLGFFSVPRTWREIRARFPRFDLEMLIRLDSDGGSGFLEWKKGTLQWVLTGRGRAFVTTLTAATDGEQEHHDAA